MSAEARAKRAACTFEGAGCSRRCLSVVVKAKTDQVSSVKLICGLTLQTLVSANIPASPGSAAIKCTLMDSLQGGEDRRCCCRAALETASLHVESVPLVSDWTDFCSVTAVLTVPHGRSNPSLWFWFPLRSHFKRARP